jgi:hypothetical protein
MMNQWASVMKLIVILPALAFFTYPLMEARAFLPKMNSHDIDKSSRVMVEYIRWSFGRSLSRINLHFKEVKEMKRNPVLALFVVLLCALIVGAIGIGIAGWKLQRRKE